MKKIFLKNWHMAILIFISLIILISHGLYVLETYQYPEMDEQHYMDMSVGAYRLLKNPTIQTPIDIIKLVPFRQSGYSLSILPFLLVFGIESSYKIALFLNGFYYIATIFAIYLIARYFFGKGLSLLSAFTFAVYGFPLFYLHFTYSETATTTFVALSILFLLKSNLFVIKKYSLLFGLTLGLGLLTRWVVLIFLAGPLIWTFYLMIKDKQISLKNLFFAILISVLISFPPYIVNKESFFGFYIKTQLFYGPLWDMVPSYRKTFISFQSAAYYFKVFEQLTIFFFIPFVLGLLNSLKKAKKYGFLFLAFFVPYLIFSFGTIIKDDRYIVPIYPSIALLTTIFIESIKKKFFKKILITLIVLLGIGSFFGGIWGVGPMGQEGLKSVLIPMPIGHPRRIHLTSMVWPPTKNFSNADKIMDFIDRDSKNNNIEKPNIVNAFSFHPVDNALLSINKYHREDMFNMQNFVGTTVLTATQSAEFVIGSFRSADYLILKKEGSIIDNYFTKDAYFLSNIFFEFIYSSEKILKDFIEAKRFNIPIDNSYIIIYRRHEESDDNDLKPLYDFIRRKTLFIINAI